MRCASAPARPRRRFIPVSDQYVGNKFFTIENGVRKATPLLLVLAVVEISDVVFAVDSIPAVRRGLCTRSPGFGLGSSFALQCCSVVQSDSCMGLVISTLTLTRARTTSVLPGNAVLLPGAGSAPTGRARRPLHAVLLVAASG